jgi:TRAP-type C4-dicarboxylate transport system permease small subunit
MLAYYRKIDTLLGHGLRWSSIGTLTAILILMVGNVLVRFIPLISFGWFDEIIELLIAWFIFFGAAALWREREHFTVAFLPDWLKGRTAACALGIVIDLVSLVFLAMFTYYSLDLTMRARAVTGILMLPKKLFYICMPVSGAIMIAYSLRNIIENGYGLYRGAGSSISR